MCLLDLFSIIGALHLGKPIESYETVDEYDIAKIASDTFYYKDKDGSLVFTKSAVDKEKVTASFLTTDYKLPKYLLFTYKDGDWSVEQSNNLANYMRMLKFKKDEDSDRFGIVNPSIYSKGSCFEELQTNLISLFGSSVLLLESPIVNKSL